MWDCRGGRDNDNRDASLRCKTTNVFIIMKCTSKRVEKTKTHPCNLGERRWACLVEAEMKGFGRGKRVLTQVFLEYLT